VKRLFMVFCIVSCIQGSGFSQDAGEFKSIHAAAAAGDAGSIVAFIQKGVSANAKDSTGKTPLMCAAETGMSRVFPILIERGAEIDAIDNDGNTALHHGVMKGYIKVITDLVSGGANGDIKNGKDRTAKELAYDSRNPRLYDAFPGQLDYGRDLSMGYNSPTTGLDKLKEVINDPNQVRARLIADPELVSELDVLFKALEGEEKKWTSRKRRIMTTFYTSMRNEIDSEIVFVRSVAEREDANNVADDLGVLRSTWKSIFSQSSRKMREASRGVSVQGMQTSMRSSRTRGRRGQSAYDAPTSRRTRGRGTDAVEEVNPHEAYISSWGNTNDTSLDAIYKATEEKFMNDIGTIRVLAEGNSKARTVNAIDGVMLERKLRGERSLVVYNLTKEELAAQSTTGSLIEGTSGRRGRRGSMQETQQTGRRGRR